MHVGPLRGGRAGCGACIVRVSGQTDAQREVVMAKWSALAAWRARQAIKSVGFAGCRVLVGHGSHQLLQRLQHLLVVVGLVVRSPILRGLGKAGRKRFKGACDLFLFGVSVRQVRLAAREMDILRGQAGWRIWRHAACPPPPNPNPPTRGRHTHLLLGLVPALDERGEVPGRTRDGRRSAQTGWLVKASASLGDFVQTRPPPPPDRARTHAARVLT